MKHALAILCLLAVPATAWAQDDGLVKENADDPVAVIKTSMGDVYVELFVKEAPETVANFLGLAEGTKEFKDATSGAMVKRPYYDGLVFHRVIADFMVQGGCPLGNGSGSPGFTFKDEIDAKALGLHEIKGFEGDRPHAWTLIRTQPEFEQKILLPLVHSMGIDPSQIGANRAKIRERLATMSLADIYTLMGYEYLEGVGAHKPLRGVLAMANTGANSNGSQFFVNLKDTPWLTGKHTVFGKVIKGMDVVEKIGGVPTTGGNENRPLQDVKILSIRELAER